MSAAAAPPTHMNDCGHERTAAVQLPPNGSIPLQDASWVKSLRPCKLESLQRDAMSKLTAAVQRSGEPTAQQSCKRKYSRYLSDCLDPETKNSWGACAGVHGCAATSHARLPSDVCGQL